MNILYICSFYHRAFIFRDLLNSVEKQNHFKITVFNAAQLQAVIYDKYREIMDDKVIHKECFNKMDRYLFSRKRKKILAMLVSSTNINSYDLIHAHSLMTGGYVALKGIKHTNCKYIVSIRNTDVNVHLRIPMMRFIAKKIVDNAIGVHFLSEEYRKYFIRKFIPIKERPAFEARSIVIPNGVEAYWLANLYKRVPSQAPGNEIKLLFVGKIDRNKNVAVVLKTCDALIEAGYNVTLSVIGQVVNRSVYKKLFSKSYVSVFKYMTKEELLLHYRKHTIFLMPSKSETFGRVYVEAMSQGMPVIYTRGQGFDGLFADGKIGYAVDRRNPKNIVESIVKILHNYIEISHNCTEQAKQFSWDNIGKKYDLFYRSLTAHHD